MTALVGSSAPALSCALLRWLRFSSSWARPPFPQVMARGATSGRHAAAARAEGSARLACGCRFDPRSDIEVKQGHHSLAVVAERAQVPRLPDREDAAAGMSRQPSLRRLGGGEERRLNAHIGVELLHRHPLGLVDPLRAEDRQDRAGGFDAHDTVAGNSSRIGVPVVEQISSSWRDGRTRGA